MTTSGKSYGCGKEIAVEGKLVVMNGVPHMPGSVHILHENILHGIRLLSRGVHSSAE